MPYIVPCTVEGQPKFLRLESADADITVVDGQAEASVFNTRSQVLRLLSSQKHKVSGLKIEGLPDSVDDLDEHTIKVFPTGEEASTKFFIGSPTRIVMNLDPSIGVGGYTPDPDDEEDTGENFDIED